MGSIFGSRIFFDTLPSGWKSRNDIQGLKSPIKPIYEVSLMGMDGINIYKASQLPEQIIAASLYWGAEYNRLNWKLTNST